jgi:hypothetical protein
VSVMRTDQALRTLKTALNPVLNPVVPIQCHETPSQSPRLWEFGRNFAWRGRGKFLIEAMKTLSGRERPTLPEGAFVAFNGNLFFTHRALWVCG